MTEMLNGIKVLKLYAWEIPFLNRICNIRDLEIELIKKSCRIWVMVNFTFTAVPMFTALAVFATYVLSDPINNVLTADKVFVTIAYFNVIRLPMVFFPYALLEGIKLTVSLGRIGKDENI